MTQDTEDVVARRIAIASLFLSVLSLAVVCASHIFLAHEYAALHRKDAPSLKCPQHNHVFLGTGQKFRASLSPPARFDHPVVDGTIVYWDGDITNPHSPPYWYCIDRAALHQEATDDGR